MNNKSVALAFPSPPRYQMLRAFLFIADFCDCFRPFPNPMLKKYAKNTHKKVKKRNFKGV
jgi:hypothetical protein